MPDREIANLILRSRRCADELRALCQQNHQALEDSWRALRRVHEIKEIEKVHLHTGLERIRQVADTNRRIEAVSRRLTAHMTQFRDDPEWFRDAERFEAETESALEAALGLS